MFKKVAIGSLVLAGGAGAYYTVNKPQGFGKPAAPVSVKNALENANEFYQFKLSGKENVTHDVRRFRFELPDKNNVVGILPGQHVVTKAKIGEKLEFRPYSPTSNVDAKGHFDLTFKVYPENSKFPGGGKMSRHLDSLKVGDQVDFKGPVGWLKYIGNGTFGITRAKDTPEEKKTYKNIGMVAGGTGLTPLYQVAKTISAEKNTPTNSKMVFSNHTENDIIMRAELDELEKQNPDKFKIWYTLTKSTPSSWKYDKGRVTADMLKKNLPAPSDDTLILVCGPPDFVKKHCIPLLVKLGHSEKNIFGY